MKCPSFEWFAFIGSVCVLLFIAFGCGQVESPAETQTPLGSTITDSRFRTYETSHGMKIGWSADPTSGATPLAVVNATIARLQYEQDTPLASDSNARALAHLMLARQELVGKPTTTEDGHPILE